MAADREISLDRVLRIARHQHIGDRTNAGRFNDLRQMFEDFLAAREILDDPQQADRPAAPFDVLRQQMGQQEHQFAVLVPSPPDIDRSLRALARGRSAPR